jgi:hypothetical protein
MKTVYKILFEVKLMHEYYLTDPDGTSVFDKTNQSDRLDFLTQRFNSDIPSINNDLEFQFPEESEKSFASQGLYLLATDSGFQVFAEVTESTLADGTITYSPSIPLPDDYAVTVLITRNGDEMDRITSSRQQRNIESVYFFSNEKLYEAKTFPFLSSAILPVNPSYAYEQGELTNDGANHIQSFYADSSGNPHWVQVSGTGFANERDRLVVPSGIYYEFQGSDKVQHAVFQLKDALNNIIQTTNINGSNLLGTVFLDLSSVTVNSLPSAAMSASILYTLHTTGDNGYTADHDIIFYDDEATLKNGWGIVRIGIKVSNPDFNILDNSGLLITRIQPDGTVTPHHFFEIPIKSQFAFWRYVSNLGLTNKLKLSTDTTNLLTNNGGKLESAQPRVLTYLPTYFKNTVDNSTHLLPNPGVNAVNKKEKTQIFTEIRVPDSQLFPADT